MYVNKERSTTEDRRRSSIQVEAEIAADLLRTNVRLEGERDRARDEVDQLTAQLKAVRAELDAWRTECQQSRTELEESEKRLRATQLDCDKLSSKCDVRFRLLVDLVALMCNNDTVRMMTTTMTAMLSLAHV